MKHLLNHSARMSLVAVAVALLLTISLIKPQFAWAQSDPYHAYRDGIVKRHILCSGRYLSELWLQEFQPGTAAPDLRSYARMIDARAYVPWLSSDGAVYGGGENPLLRGGIAMAAFSLESMSSQDHSGLRYAERLLRYFEASHLRLADGETGQFLRCDHSRNHSETLEERDGFGFHASADEISGLLLGLYYFYIATPDEHIKNRIRYLATLMGTKLKKNGFLLVGAGVRPVIQNGFSATYFTQWSIQQALQRITGNRFEPRASDYRNASAAMWTLYQNREEKIRGSQDEKRRLTQELLGIMYMWSKLHGLDPESGQRWTAELKRIVGSEVADSDLFKTAVIRALVWGDLGGFASSITRALIDNIRFDSIGKAVTRYSAFFEAQYQATYFWQTDSWWNHAFSVHSLHYALDEEVVQRNNAASDAASVAIAANKLVKAVLCGERMPKLQAWPPAYVLGTPDPDFYLAVVAEGLLTKFVPSNLRCMPSPTGFPQGKFYSAQIRDAVNARSRMWPALPARRRLDNAPVVAVRYVGVDFCWERGPGDERRVLGGGLHSKATGMTEADYATGRDAVLEAGGLDYLFPRALMSYWLHETLTFRDAGLPLLSGTSCVPTTDHGRYRIAGCDDNVILRVRDLLAD